MPKNTITILIIEDNLPLRELIRSSLVEARYFTAEAGTGKEGLAKIASERPQLILLDLGLPDNEGTELVRKVRRRSTSPILVVSARDSESAKVAALDAGADDYITKPFGMSELLARVRVALRHGLDIPASKSAIEHEGLRMDFVTHQVWKNGREVHLSPIEFKLLGVLMQNAGKMLPHQKLLNEVWGPSDTDQTHYLRVYMRQLRGKLEADPSRPRILLTEPGVGYRLYSR